MAGYFRKLVGSVYDGAHVAKADIANGIFVTLDTNGLVIPVAAADTNSVFRCVEQTDLWGMKALVLDVVSMSPDVFMVEADFPVTENSAYDETVHVTKAGEQVKMKIPLPGEQIVVTVSDAAYTAGTYGKKFNIADGGVLAAVA